MLSARASGTEFRPGHLVLMMVLAACSASEPHEDEHAHEEAEHASRDRVELSAAALARAGIAIDMVEAGPFRDAIEIPAEIELDPDRVVHVASLVAGQLIEVRASVGQRVAAGDVLAVVRSVELGDTRAALAQAQAELGVAEATHARQRELADAGIGARRNLIDAEGALRMARARVAGLRERTRVYGGRGATSTLRSSLAGEVLARHATSGEVVSPERTLFVVADASVVWVVGRAYAQDIGALRPGARATLTVRGLPDRLFHGTLDYVAPVLDEATRTLPVRVVLENPEGALRPGLYGTLRVARGDTESLTVVSAAVQREGARSVVFVPADEDGAFRVVEVTPGRTAEGRTEIIDGLEAGERYVARGAFVLKAQLVRDELEGHEH